MRSDKAAFEEMARDLHDLYVGVGGDLGDSFVAIRASHDQDQAAMRDAGYSPEAAGAMLVLQILYSLRQRPDARVWALASAMQGHADALTTLAVAMALELTGVTLSP